MKNPSKVTRDLNCEIQPLGIMYDTFVGNNRNFPKLCKLIWLIELIYKMTTCSLQLKFLSCYKW